MKKVISKKLGEDKIPIELVLELDRMKMEPNEIFKYFNQRLFTLLNKIPDTSKSTYNVSVEFFSRVLPTTISMFVKRI